MRRLFSFLMSLAVLAGIAGVGAFFVVNKRLEAAGSHPAAQVLTIPRGAGLNSISDQLHREGLISDPMMFRLGARMRRVERNLQAGEYLVLPQASMAGILDQIVGGETFERRITFAEGMTSVQIVERLNSAKSIEGAPITAIPAEGSLSPDTYFYGGLATRESLIEQMQEAQEETLNELWKTRDEGLPVKTKAEALILASIVEKETAVASERAKVAGVFINRLRRGMRLQSDPTVIYGVTNGERNLGRSITRSDLRDRNAYNTYVINGLPPTPIANPGRDAIAAVLQPDATTAIFFVADGTGGHAFADTLDEHNRNVAKWRKIERERRAE